MTVEPQHATLLYLFLMNLPNPPGGGGVAPPAPLYTLRLLGVGRILIFGLLRVLQQFSGFSVLLLSLAGAPPPPNSVSVSRVFAGPTAGINSNHHWEPSAARAVLVSVCRLYPSVPPVV